MKKIVTKLMKSGWRRNTVIAVAAAGALALAGTSVASAHTFDSSRHVRAWATQSSHTSVKAHWADWKVNSHHNKPRTVTPTPTPTTPAKPPVQTPPPTQAPAPIPAPNPSTPATPPVTAPAPSTPGSWPDASNTGVPAGVKLTASPALTITKAGTVIDGLDINGGVSIQATNVTIKNSIVRGHIDTSDSNKYPGTLIQRVEIIGPYNSAADGGIPAVGYTGFTCDGCNVRGFGKGFGLVQDAVVKNSWVHDIVVHGDPANGGSHNEAIISLGGSNFTITNNRLDAGDAPNVSASLALYSQMEPIKNVVVQGNLFDGGGYCVYAGLAGSYGSSNAKFIGNTFGSKYSAKCGGYGPATAYATGNGNEWTGNVLQNGTPVGTPSR